MVDDQRITEGVLPQRKLGGLLDETLSLYSTGFMRFIVIMAVVQVPIGIVSALILTLFSEGLLSLLLAVLVGIVGAVVVFGAVTCGVGEQYISGRIDIKRCYNRTVGRIWSLTLVAGIWFGLILIPTLGTRIQDESIASALGVLTIPIFVALAIYYSVSVQVMVVEGHKAMGSLGRSFRLVRNCWWRVFGIHLVLVLVILGLMIVLNLVLLPLGDIVIVNFLTGLVFNIVATPVLFIAGTLLYYDLRVRKEDYDFATLSREMGFAAV